MNSTETEIIASKSDSSLFAKIGGLTGVRQLADEFYNVMEQDTAALQLRQIHPEKLVNTRIKLYKFLTEWLGGPALFGSQYINAKWLELRHRHFNPTPQHEEQWLYCMDTAMTNLSFGHHLKASLNTKFSTMIQLMKKQHERISIS